MIRNIVKNCEIYSLADLIDYSPGAIVSKIILKKEKGSETLFAIDKGEEISEHTTPFDAIVKVIEGEAEIIISGTKYNLKGGEMIIMPAGEPHSLKAVSKFKMLLTMFRA